MAKHNANELDARIAEAVESAQWDFWSEIIKHFPEIKTGDTDPWDSMMFQQTLEETVLQWYRDNKPRKENHV